MARYCTQCGNLLESCICCADFPPHKTGFFANLKKRVGIGYTYGARDDERRLRIVPDCVARIDGEIPLRQYDVALLRTGWKHMRAKGRLQVTNKRLLFRAVGRSFLGRTVLHSEYDISQISSVEFRRDWRFRLGSFVLNGLVLLAVNLAAGAAGGVLTEASKAIGLLVALLCGLAGIALFFAFPKHFLLKALAASTGAGLLLGTGGVGLYDVLAYGELGGSDSAFMLIFTVPVLLIAFAALLLHTYRPELRIRINPKSGVDAAAIQPGKTSGFAEIIPTAYTETAIREIGAMIQDIQAPGSPGIEKWRERS